MGEPRLIPISVSESVGENEEEVPLLFDLGILELDFGTFEPSSMNGATTNEFL